MSAINEALTYFTAETFHKVPGTYRAENRNEINGRLLAWNEDFKRNGAVPATAAILAAILGELGNNCFDHNLGKWNQLPGCLITIDFVPDRFRIAVVDRGQGIANSLRRVRPDANNIQLLKAAFEEVISGRSPERRGNGLKFVRKNFLNSGGIGLVCLSSQASYSLGTCEPLLNALSPVKEYAGTLVAIDWSRS